MKKDEATKLISSYLAGTCTPDEKALIKKAYLLLGESETTDLSADQIAQLEKAVLGNITRQAKIKMLPKRRSNIWLYAAASLVFALLLVGSYLWKIDPVKVPAVSSVPGFREPQPVLLTINGKTFSLSGTQSGIRQGTDGISYLDGSLVDLSLLDQDADIAKHILTTPKGGMYSVTLSDGSIVSLNAGTTLTYPSRFDDEERVVYLEGEAYFKITTLPSQTQGANNETPHDNIPFKVISKGQTVEVLGTEFNLSAYPEETDIKTTLVKGSVQIRNSQSGTVNQLRPGEQGITSGDLTHVKNVNTEQYTAWKNNEFVFDGASISEVMNTLARWYDVEIVYEGTKPPDRYGGGLSRSEDISKVLELLEKTGGVRFRMEERTIHVLGDMH